MTSAPWSRCDDLRAGTALQFPPAEAVLVAGSSAEVEPTLRAAEAATRAGRWVWGFVTYEAGLVLTGATDVATVDGLPLVWFGVSGAPAEVEPIRAGAGGYEVGPWTGDLDRAAHARAVRTVRDQIAAGDVYQVNLTARWSAPVAGDLLAYHGDLVARQRGAHNMFVDAGRFTVLSVSPESFVERRGDEIVMRPMKGTAPRGRDLSEDAALVAALRASEKDRAENVMIVDLVRNDLARVAVTGSVTVRSLCAVERYETVHQSTSEVTARLRPGVDLVEWFSALFPSGSVTGAPKRRATEIIRRIEGRPRGIYCGAVGFLAPPDAPVSARFNVAIRTVVVDRARSTATYGSGGGITWSSDADAEFEELLTKTAVLRPAPVEPRLLETMRADPGGEVHLLERHLGRMRASAAYLGYAYDEDLIRKAVGEAAVGSPVRRVRLLLDRAGRVEVETSDLPVAEPGPVRLTVDLHPVDRTSRWLRHKSTDRRVYDERRARHPDVDDVVLVNADGEVTETSVANILVSLDGSWWTPPLDCGCLPGVGRGRLLDLGVVAERVLTVGDLHAADALAVVSSVRGCRPAVLVDAVPSDDQTSGNQPTRSRRHPRWPTT